MSTREQPLPTVYSAPNLALPPRKRAVLIGLGSEDRDSLRRMLDDLEWDSSSVRNCWLAFELLSCGIFAVVFCESKSWKKMLQPLRGDSEMPPLVVVSRVADAHLWSEVLNLGGYDVLVKPFKPGEVAHVLKSVSLNKQRPVLTAASGAVR
jgi:DNA-binding NtrC family response regulator